ncbi:MAG TPA: hypothetical protein VMR00_19790 [Streptosporangiaceae bacterium]|jgi:hypothetical protein|nr:hypothetical protein [Streptosporangiaceae bacterium]
MFEAWGDVILRRRRLVPALAVLGVPIAAVRGTGVFGRLQSAGGFAPPASQLVPAAMRLPGRANWWAPGPLRRLYARLGIGDDDDDASAQLAEPAATVRSGSG